MATCRRCGAFVCESCLTLAGDDAYCAACAARRLTPASARARSSVWLPIAAFVAFALSFGTTSLTVLGLLGPPLWFTGVGLNIAERRRLRAKTGEELASRRWLRVGSWLCLPAILALLPLVILVVELFFHWH